MLIDTCALLWYGLEPERLSKRAVEVIREQGNFCSHVSLWEMAIKSGSGKLALTGADGQPTSAKQFMLNMIGELRLRPLMIEFDDLSDVEGLPAHHKDLFDRLLVVQAKRRDLPIVSSDKAFDHYGIERVW